MHVWRMSIRGGRSLIAAAALLVLLADGAMSQSTQPASEAAPATDAAAQQATPQNSSESQPATEPAVLEAPGSARADRPFWPRPILPPAEPAAASAYAVLEKHCARCHQGGRLKRAAPAAGFGNVLRLDELPTAPHLVQPGNPDASRLYLMMLRRLMPFDVHSEGASEPAPGAEEIAVVRTWISGLPPRAECRDRRFVTPADHAAALAQLAASTGENPAKLRFVSIAHLHNGCVGFEALAAYRHAVVRLINSLSWRPAPVAVPPIDIARTLFKINLDDLGWLAEHWERIMHAGSDPLGLAPPLPEDVRRPFGTSVPIAKADWFAETVLSAPLYYDVLGLPGTGPEILKILQIDTIRLLESGNVARAGVRPSRFATGPSYVERYPSRTGAFWQAYHQFPRDSMADLSQQALRPATEPVPHHVSRSTFTLPNGLPGFFVVGQRGDRLDALPPDIALPSASAQGVIRGGLDCLTCHAGGPAERDLSGLPRAASEAIAADRKATAEALRRIGIDPELTLDGVEPVVALANEHARPLDGVRAAAELGISPEELTRLADRGDGPPSILARRLVQGLVSRSEVDARARDLIGAMGRPIVDAAAVPPRPANEIDYRPIDSGPGLVLYSDKARYRKGDLLNIVVRVGADCHLTVVSIDQRGRGTVIFPSDFESNTLLTAGQELRLPGPGAPYSFRLNEPGRETIVALCNEAGSATDGIRHDFERQRFTDLGNYATHLAQNAIVDTSKGATAATAAPRRPEPRQRSRRAGKPETPEERSRPERVGRTAITIVVE